MRLKGAVFLGVGLALASSLLPRTARADDPATTQSPARWYGWQTLAVDVGGFAGASVIGGSLGDTAPTGLFVGWLGAYTLGAPVVHAAHGHWGRAAISASMRAGAWLVGGGTGAAIGSATGDARDMEDAMLFGAISGAVIPVVIDTAFLARDPAATEVRGATPPLPVGKVTVTPTAAATPRGGAVVGVVGTF